MIQAVRNDLKAITNRLDKPENLSLLFDRFCSHIDEPNNKESSQKENVIEKLITYYPNAITDASTEEVHVYQYAFNQWRRYLQEDPSILFFTLQTCSPMVVGSGDQNVHEFGITLQLPWATPVIPGTAVKGVASAFAHQYGGVAWQKHPPDDQVNAPPPESGSASVKFFGGIDNNDNAFAGAVDFLPAWWVPDTPRPFIKDIVTVHNCNYYQTGESFPDGTDDPLPNSFVVIQPGECFLFALKGPENWTDTAAKIIKLAASKQGFGAKTRVGYGLFEDRSLEELAHEIPNLDDHSLADMYDTRKHIKSLSSGFQKAAMNRNYQDDLRELFLVYRPETVFWIALSQLKNPNWNNIRNTYQQYCGRLEALATALDPVVKTNIYQFCLGYAPQPMPQWLNELAPNANELLAGKDADEILMFLENWNAPSPTIEEFRAVVKQMNGLDADAKELLLLDLEDRTII
jgi:CRISPR type III-B/RAMP module RAMP protein Cmr6